MFANAFLQLLVIIFNLILMLTEAKCIWWKYSKNSNIVKYYYNLKEQFSIFNIPEFIPVMAKLNFQ